MAKHQRNCWVLLIIGDAPMAMLSIGIVSISIMLISITITTATDALTTADIAPSPIVHDFATPTLTPAPSDHLPSAYRPTASCNGDGPCGSKNTMTCGGNAVAVQ